ncbi:MAG TPA: TonB-dependent receptor [Ideonella sp.]|nr:TonB-dependent receptor [Ideonella sp.]
MHYDDGPGADARARLRNGVQALTLDGRVAAGWRTTLRASRSQDDYDTVASASPYADLGTISTTERRLTWENALDAGPVGTAVGVIEHVSQDVAKPGAAYDVGSRTIDSAALALNGAAGPHVWQASIRRDRNSEFGRLTTGGLGYALHLGAAWQLGASYGTSFVAPSFNQLYYPGYGNPGLQPERGHATELHARWAEGDQSLRLTAFRQRMRGYITTGENPVNVARASIDGLTLAWERQWSAVTANLAVDHLTPRNDVDGTPLVRRARNDAKAAVDWRLDDRASVGATWTAYSTRRDVGGYDANFAPTYVTLGAYATLDLRADWRLARAWSLGVRLNNVTGKVYETAYGYNQPRREGYVVLSWRPR